MFVLRVLSRWCAATLAVGSFVSMIALAACSGNSSTQGKSQSSQLGDPDSSCVTDAGITCPAPFTACPFDGITICVNTAVDPTNCGACGNACSAGQICSSGVCTNIISDAGITCPPPFTTCPFDGTNICVNTAVDPTNCGACGVTCSAGQICSSGKCTNIISDAGIMCPPPFTACPFDGTTACVNTNIDPTNCGACGVTCAVGQFCSSGTCTNIINDAGIMCPQGLTSCPFDGTSICVNTNIDPTNCGACGVTCAVGQFCSSGKCTSIISDAGIPCPPGFTACPFDGITACVLTNIDPNNCGECGNRCSPGDLCTNGSCWCPY